MRVANRFRWRDATLALVLMLASPGVNDVFAQERGPVLEFAAGVLGFADDGIVSEGMVGGAVGFPVTERIRVGPEVLLASGERHRHLIATGNITCDMVRPTRTVVPFLVGGGGFFQTRDQFPSGTFTSTEGAFTAGGGIRAAVTDRVYAGVDVRVGWELHVRFNAIVGVRLAR
jgi:hypothetical protein